MRTTILAALWTTSAWASPSAESMAPAPRHEWTVACRSALGRDDEKVWFSLMRRMVSERFPAAMVIWERCRDRNAAERWGWAALMQERDAQAFLKAMKGACGE